MLTLMLLIFVPLVITFIAIGLSTPTKRRHKGSPDSSAFFLGDYGSNDCGSSGGFGGGDSGGCGGGGD